MVAGRYVNIFSDDGVPSIRYADVIGNRPADGFIVSDVAAGARADVYLEGINRHHDELETGTTYCLGRYGQVVQISEAPPYSNEVNLMQIIGRALNDRCLEFDPDIIPVPAVPSPVKIEFSFAGSAPPTLGDNEGSYGICHTAGGSFDEGDIVYDDGVTLLAHAKRYGVTLLLTTSAISGDIDFAANSLYTLLNDVWTRMIAVPAGGTNGQVLTTNGSGVFSWTGPYNM